MRGTHCLSARVRHVLVKTRVWVPQKALFHHFLGQQKVIPQSTLLKNGASEANLQIEYKQNLNY
jgi:hypothetical protein